MPVLGLIGGSGFHDFDGLRNGEMIDVETPFGRPSAPVLAGEVKGVKLFFVPRHGQGHVYAPATIPYRANIHAFKQLGVTHVVSLSAVGSLREDLPPRSIVLPDQIIDRTLDRQRTFFDDGVVAHVGIADPFCGVLTGAIAEAAAGSGVMIQRGGTYVCIEGPQFSTRAESALHRAWGGSIVGMTAMPEARLAREAELCYATMAMVTDYDVWHESEADVTVNVVLTNLRVSGKAVMGILDRVLETGLPGRSCDCERALDHAIMTAPSFVSPAAWARVALLTGDRLKPS